MLNAPAGKRAGLSHPVKPQTARPEHEVLAVCHCWWARVVKGTTWGISEAPQPFTPQQVPPTPWHRFTPACPAAGLDRGGSAGEDTPGTQPGRSNRWTGAGKRAKTARERGDAEGAGLLPSRDMVTTEGCPRLSPHPDVAAGLAREAAMEAKHGCTGGWGGHPRVPGPPHWAVLQSSAKAGMPGMRNPGALPRRPPPSAAPHISGPVARTGYSPERATYTHTRLVIRKKHSVSVWNGL